MGRWKYPSNAKVMRFRSLRSDSVRQVLVVGIVATLAACTFGDSEAGRLKGRIDQAQRDLLSQSRTDIQFKQPIRLNHAYVVVLVPAQGITKEEVARLDLPFEAKRSLDLQIENPSFEKKGPVLGVLEPERAEWYPLDSVFVSELRYVWKQAGEDVELILTRKERGTEITALR
jgi:hypothetical protein